MPKPVADLTSTQHGMSARAKRYRLAIALALVLGTVIAGASSAPHSARAVTSNGLVFGPFQGSGESWEVTGCAAVCADPVIIPSVVDGKPVLGIGQSSFWYDTSLREVRIPATITTISSYAFGGSSATNYVVDPTSTHFKSVGGMLLTKDGTELVAYPGGAVATSVTVPAGVRKLRMGSFYSNGPATSVSLPTSLEEIEQQVFNLSGLTTIEIPVSVSVIGEDAFGAAMANISVASGNPTFRATDGVLFRGNELFMYPRGRTAASYQIPAGTTAIQDTALDRNAILASISLPVSLTTLTSNPLRGMSALSSISVETGHPTFSAVDGVLFKGGALIAYPKARAGATYSVPSGTTEIGPSAFMGASALTAITLPDSITVVGSDAFAYIADLVSVNLPPNLTTLGGQALYYTKVTNVVVPHTVTEWGNQVFGYNQNSPGAFHVYFEGDAPPAGVDIGQNTGAIVHRIDGTTGWPAFSDPYLGYTQTEWNPNISAPRAPSGVALAESVRVTARRGSGGLPTSYLVESSPGNAGCTITLPAASCVVSGLTAGVAYTFTTKATKGQTTTGVSPASSVIRPLGTQTISFTRPADRKLSAIPFLVTATSNSSLAVVLTSSTQGVCTVSGFEVTMLTVGTCTLNANAAGNSSYADATEVSHTFQISETPTTTPSVTTPVEAPSESVVKGLPRAQTPLVSETTLTTGSEITVTFGGFTPFEFVQLIVASTPQVIGSGYADASGVVTISGILPSSLAAGNHTLAVYAPVSGIGFSQPITVSLQTLPATGSNDLKQLVLVALLLLLSGLVVRRARLTMAA